MNSNYQNTGADLKFSPMTPNYGDKIHTPTYFKSPKRLNNP